MNDKEKQIEEIKRIIDDRCEAELGQVHANSKDGKVTKTVDTSLIAKDIYKCLTDNFVVLTREDLKHYAKDCLIGELAGLDILNGLIERAKRKEKEAVKETAEKILKWLKEHFDGVGWAIVETYFKEKFGVELGGDPK